MMRIGKRTLLAAVLSTSVVAPAVHAASAGDTYAGGQFVHLDYSETGVETLNPSAIVGRFGYHFSDNFALEGRAGFGLSDDETSLLGVDVSLELDSLFGVYGVGYLPLGQSASVYGLIGFTNAEMTAKASNQVSSASFSDDDSDLSFGVGAELKVSKAATINLEYTSYLSESAYDLEGLGVGVKFTF